MGSAGTEVEPSSRGKREVSDARSVVGTLTVVAPLHDTTTALATPPNQLQQR